MNRLLVLADDYTGALDTGVQFSKKGAGVLVLSLEQVSFRRARDMDISVLVVNMESRHIHPGDAYRLVRNIAGDAVNNGVNYFYKKTDSALRGNIGAELAGLLDAGADSCLSFIPAFPRSGRITKDGVHYIDGVEAARSVFANDPSNPVAVSSVADIIRMQTDIPTEVITRDSYPTARKKPSGRMIRILDAESMDDMAEIGFYLKRGGNLRLTAGCAGFAEILPDLLELKSRKTPLEHKGGGALIVSGSLNPITIRQLSRGDEMGFAVFTLSPQQKLDARYLESRECGDFIRKITEELAAKGRVIIRAVGNLEEAEDAARTARNLGIPEGEISSRAASQIGELTLRILNSAHIGNLVVFGGDTLHSILGRMRCCGVVPVLEPATGVVAAQVLSPDHKCVIITKSGGLGDDDALNVIDGFLKETQMSSSVPPIKGYPEK